MKHPRWQVPAMWQGAVVAIIGGGPSLTREQVEACRGRCKVIAVNTAYKIAPWADMLYWCDEAWGFWHREDPDFKAFAGIKVALQNARTWTWDPSIKILENYGDSGLCEIRDGVMTGKNSGAQAMNLAYHLGGRAQILLGFDMRAHGARAHWHTGAPYGHQRPTPLADFENTMLPHFPKLKEGLDRKGVRVFNCTPGSALKCFPAMTLHAALEMFAAEDAARRANEQRPIYFATG